LRGNAEGRSLAVVADTHLQRDLRAERHSQGQGLRRRAQGGRLLNGDEVAGTLDGGLVGARSSAGTRSDGLQLKRARTRGRKGHGKGRNISGKHRNGGRYGTRQDIHSSNARGGYAEMHVVRVDRRLDEYLDSEGLANAENSWRLLAIEDRDTRHHHLADRAGGSITQDKASGIRIRTAGPALELIGARAARSINPSEGGRSRAGNEERSRGTGLQDHRPGAAKLREGTRGCR
jgi:hypothetical protein